MAKGKVKRQEGELLDEEHVERAIAFLEGGGTKKEAYDILNIKANPSRLQKIFDEYHEGKERDKRLRSQKRGTPVTDQEVSIIVSGALEGTAIGSIAKDLYRPIDFVKRVLDGVGIPRKLPGNWYDRRYQSSIPDQCISETFDVGELVWSEKHGALAIVREEIPKSDGSFSYQIYVIEKIEQEMQWALNGKIYTGYGGAYATQPAYQLGSLRHLEKYGIDLYRPYRESFGKWLK